MLRAVIEDERVRLFLDDGELEKFRRLLQDIEPLFDNSDLNLSRNAVERFMISFSNFRKESAYDEERQLCRTTVYYRPEDSETVLGNIISFGPTVRVASPQKSAEEIVRRLKRQKELLKN